VLAAARRSRNTVGRLNPVSLAICRPLSPAMRHGPDQNHYVLTMPGIRYLHAWKASKTGPFFSPLRNTLLAIPLHPSLPPCPARDVRQGTTVADVGH
jgi:hypothetical protein